MGFIAFLIKQFYLLQPLLIILKKFSNGSSFEGFFIFKLFIEYKGVLNQNLKTTNGYFTG